MSQSDLPKLWTTSSKFAKFVLSKSFFGIKNQPNPSEFFFCEEYLTRRLTFIHDFFWKLWFLKYILYFLKMCLIFGGSVHNFGNIIYWKNAYFHKWYHAQLEQKILDGTWYVLWTSGISRIHTFDVPRE